MEAANYISLLILNIFNGVAENVGVKDPDKLASKPPDKLAKAKKGGFLSGFNQIGKRIKGFIGRKLVLPAKKFRLRGINLYRKKRPVTKDEWDEFSKQVNEYLEPYLDPIAEELTVKSVLLGMASADQDQRGKATKDYRHYGYEQIEKDKFGGVMPDTIDGANKRFNINRDLDNAMHVSYARAAEFVVNVGDDVRSAIRSQVDQAYRLGKSPEKLASDLYWDVQKNPEIRFDTAEQVMRNWLRVAKTEMAIIHERGKLASDEGQARESLDDPAKAVYYVFNGSGRCDWCNPRQGTVVRLIPLLMVTDENNDSLTGMGIEDPHTDTAIWQGKNNVGRKKFQWRIATPVHPNCACTFSRIHPEYQQWDDKNDRIVNTNQGLFRQYLPADIIKEDDDLDAKLQMMNDAMAADRAKGIHKPNKFYHKKQFPEKYPDEK